MNVASLTEAGAARYNRASLKPPNIPPQWSCLLFAVVAYLIGSVSFAVVVQASSWACRTRTAYGSGNPGATNVLRTGNKKAAILTLIGDGLKGWFAVWLARHFGPGYGLEDSGVALAALGVFLGHLFPVFHRFAGARRGHGSRHPVRDPSAAGRRHAGHVADHRVLLPLFVAGRAGVGHRFAPFFYVLMFGVDIITGAVFVISVLLVVRHRQKYRQAAGRQGKPDRRGRKAG